MFFLFFSRTACTSPDCDFVLRRWLRLCFITALLLGCIKHVGIILHGKKQQPPLLPILISQTSPCPTPIPPTYTIKQDIPIPRLRRCILRFFSQTPALSLLSMILYLTPSHPLPFFTPSMHEPPSDTPLRLYNSPSRSFLLVRLLANGGKEEGSRSVMG